MEGRIVQPDDPELSPLQRDECDLVDEQLELVPVRQLDEPIDRDPAIVVVIAQREVHGSHLTQTGEEPKQRSKALRDIEEISGHEAPVRP